MIGMDYIVPVFFLGAFFLEVIRSVLLAIASILVAGVSYGNSLKFAERSYDFGEVTRGEILSWQVNFENSGKGEVRIHGVYSSCGCTAVELDADKVYRAGDQGSILVKFDTTNFVGAINKQIIVNTGERRRSQHSLRVKANVKEEYRVEPVLIDYGLVSGLGPVKKVIDIVPVGGFDLEVRKVEYNSDIFTVEMEGSAVAPKMPSSSLEEGSPDVSGDQKESNLKDSENVGNAENVENTGISSERKKDSETILSSKKGKKSTDRKIASITVSLNPANVSGFLKETLFVHTNSAFLPKVKVPIRADIKSKISHSPDYIEFGVVRLGKEVERVVTLKSREPFLIESVKSSLHVNNSLVSESENLYEVRVPEKSGKVQKVYLKLKPKEGFLGSVHGSLLVVPSNEKKREIKIDFYSFFK